MIEFMSESSGNTLGIHASGKLTKTDYETILIPKLAELFKAHGQLNIVFYMDETFQGWDLEAAWDDASYGLMHRADFGKLAVVGGPAWVDRSIRLIGFLIKGEIRVFGSDQLAQAWQWIRT
ncbi:STAS/SEC14 domain-containing protein [Hoeflea sp. AS16]|uniref:STAS/SEC14 domain-containing protein n=1 Tax=Hoeflea sp. AS16 TaxID=3135779 RepID=UPI00316DB5F2